MVAVSVEAGFSEQSATVAPRRSQNIARSRRRRRRPNIMGEKRTVEVVLSVEEYERVARSAEEANCTVPWYLAQCALEPVAPATKDGGPWLSWPKRREIVRALMSAASALDMLRLHHVSKIGGNLNQLTRLANVDQHIPDDVLEDLPVVLEQLEAVGEDLRERAERLEELAQKAARR
ncbi:plasmid mobilization relaxosome protein MobC [Nocardia sp. NPDC127579]|uniref:plasmid mobilization relaxosome protein MobC n=1 Tax=Nocardia sp. NPDC127579 TaxID=3345402 RepID=UPI00363A831F